jgi:hypothetical protein
MEEGTVERGLGYKNAAIISKNFIEGGYDLVVVDYVFEHRRHVDRFLTWAPQKIPVYLFTLWAPLNQVMEQERTRAGRERLGERVQACYKTMQDHIDDLGHLIMNDQIDPASLASRINEAADAGKGLIQNQEGDSRG